jgi:fumarate reductase flavoprotein subunit
MSKLTDKISYLRGLAEGMKLNPDKDSHRLILGILEVLGEVGDSYEALAEEIGIPADAFAATMNDWNQKVAAKADPDFGRVSFANPLDTAPFYAIKVTAGVHHTMGGVRINESTQVLRADGTAITGLFAAGEVTGGVHGANRLGGNAVADIIVFGRIAGQSAAEFVK